MIHCRDHLSHGSAVFLQQLHTADGSVVGIVGSGKAVFGLLCKEFDAVVDVVDGAGLLLCCGTEIAGNVQHFFGRAIKALGNLGNGRSVRLRKKKAYLLHHKSTQRCRTEKVRCCPS